MTKTLPAAILACIAVGCAQPAPRESAPAPTPAVEDEPEPAPSVARADALLEDMRRREAAYQQLERDLPKAPTPDEIMQRAQANIRAHEAAAVVTQAQGIAAPAPVAAPTASAAAPARDETWWKDQMRSAEVKLEEDLRRAEAARSAMYSATLRITQDQAEADYNARLAEVANSRAAVARIAEDARRANVPPGWLRWR